MMNRQSYHDYGYNGHGGYREDQDPRYRGYEGEESYGQQYYGGEEQHYDREYDQDPQFFEEPDQDQNYHEESAGFERHTEHESSFFESSREFDLDGGSFSAVAGSVYYTEDNARSFPYEEPAPRPPNPRRTSYFKGASNFRITDGDFMSVGGNVYGLQRPSARQPGGPPRSRMQGQGRYGVPPPQGAGRPPAGASQNPNGFGQGPNPPYQTRNPSGRRNERGGSQNQGGSYPPRGMSGSTRRPLAVGRGQGGMDPRVRPPVDQTYHPREDSDYYDEIQHEQHNPTIQVVSPVQSVPVHQVPTSTVTQHVSDAETTTNTTKLSSVTAQMGGLSLKASAERSQTLYMKHSEPAADHSRNTMVPPMSSVIDVSPPANPYPSPRTSYLSSLDTIHNPNPVFTATSQEQSHPPGPSAHSGENIANSGVTGAKKKSKFPKFLRRK